MNSTIDICNKALTLIGAKNIISIDDGSKEARNCNLLWDGIRDAVMRRHAWNCCLERATLAQMSETPDFEYDYQYQLPADPYCLRVLETYPHTVTYRIEGRKLLTNEEGISIKYIARVTDIVQWDALLKDAVAYRMAAELAYSLANNATLASSMRDDFKLVIIEARDMDAIEGEADTLEDSDFSWVNTR